MPVENTWSTEKKKDNNNLYLQQCAEDKKQNDKKDYNYQPVH
jgi:hypothetical protein